VKRETQRDLGMRRVSASTSDDVRRWNLSRILRQLHVDGELSRSELVAKTGLNRSTVATLVAELAGSGLVAEVRGSAGSVGRPSLLVTPVRESAFVLAFDMRVERIIAAAMGLDGRILVRIDRLHKRNKLTPGLAARELAHLATELLSDLPDGSAWVGTGIAIPAVVDARAGLVRFAPNLGWIDTDFAALVIDEFTARFDGSPEAIVDNDANLGALAESIRGAGSDLRSLVFISGDIGIGGGVIVDGTLLTGAGGYAGEIGHMVVNPQGRECRCGSRGCWETEIGSLALLRAAGSRFSDVPSVVAAANAGDEEALIGLKVVTEWLAIGLGNLANAYNPDAIILGGHLTYLAQFAEGAVKSQLQAWTDGRQHNLPLREPGLADDSSLLGAGEAAFESLLENPLQFYADSFRLAD
jgi:predicted NBD/HSP70 family sugar kinase